jgi:hypothetical protein
MTRGPALRAEAPPKPARGLPASRTCMILQAHLVAAGDEQEKRLDAGDDPLLPDPGRAIRSG